jgi:formylglycine-generating enzyme required for sulfatase activity
MVSFLEPKPYEQAFAELLRALGLSGAPVEPPRAQPVVPPTPPTHVAPPDRFPPRLAELGYRVAFLNGAEVILPPLCDVPAGPFLMGSDPNKDKDAKPVEQPQHWVTLEAFQIAKYPVTVAEYACFVRATARSAPPGEDGAPYEVSWRTQLSRQLDHPVINVNCHDAVAYANWLAECTEQPWRLPTEAEWGKGGTLGRSDRNCAHLPVG